MEPDFRYTLVIGEQRHELPEGETTVGRSRSSGLRIDDESVSRNHATLGCHDGRVTLRDLGSSNGTFVGTVRVAKEIPVAPRDLLRFGTVLGRIEIESNRPSAETTIPLGNPCPSCGVRNPEGQHRCLNCAAALPVDELRATTSVAPLPPPPPRPVESALPAPRPAPPGDVPRKERPTVRSSVIDLPLQPPSPEAAPPVPRKPARAGQRLAAAGVDALVLLAVDLLFVIPALLLTLIHQAIGQMGGAGPERLFRLIFWALVAGAVVVTAGYFVTAWSGSGRTFGQKRYGLRVETSDGTSPIPSFRAITRFLALLLAVVPLGVGLVPLLFGRPALHDLLAGTRVSTE